MGFSFRMVSGRSAWLCGVLCAASLARAGGGDWPQWRGPERNGAADETALLIDRLPADGLLPVWQAEVPGGGSGGWGSPVVTDGLVLLATHVREKTPGVELPEEEFPPLTEPQKSEMSPEEEQAYERKRDEEQRRRREAGFVARDTLLAFDAATGRERWRSGVATAATRFPQSGTPAVRDGRAFHLTADRALRCVDLADGRERWSTPLPGPAGDGEQTPSSVLVVGGLAVVFAGPLSAVDAASGEVRWRNADLSNRESSPAVWKNGDESLLVVNTADGRTHLVSPETGASLRSVETGASRSSPVVAGDLLVTAGESRKAGVSAWTLSEAGIEFLWTYRRIADPGATPAVAAGRVFAVGDKRISGLDAATGEPVFESRLDVGQPRYTSPIAVGGRVLYTHEGLFMFGGEGDGEPLIAAVVGEGGRIAPEDWFREKLAPGAADPEAGVAAREEFMSRYGPLDCASPAFAGGCLYLRLKQGLACYDLRDEG